jgi:hypothetical protein
LDLATGTWRTLSGSPQPLRIDWALGPQVWTGQQVLALGSPEPEAFDQPVRAMLLDPRTDTWRVGEPIPGPSRREFAWVWTGQRLLVWGGHHRYETHYPDEQAVPPEAEPWASWDSEQQRWVVDDQEWLADGWAYDPGADTWDPISPAPVPGASESYATWTGTEMIVWGGTTGRDALPWQTSKVGAAYTPATDTWRTIADPPVGAVGEAQSFAPWLSVWTGNEFLVWSVTFPEDNNPDDDQVPLHVTLGAAYHPATDTWRALPDTPLWGAFRSVWTGSAALLTGHLIGDHELFDQGEWLPFARVVEYQPGPYR